MKIPTLLRHLCALSAVTAITHTATAQAVYLSEVRADGQEAWIELHNRGTTTTDLSTWSLHVSSHTPGMPKDYWWAFPAGTALQPDQYLRVHWHQSPNGPVQPGDLYTGTSYYGFLFGLGSEPLHGSEGAVALVRSQSNSMTDAPAAFVDWVAWGVGGHLREYVAVAAGLWSPTHATPAIPNGSSVARDVAQMDAVADADQAWFIDHSPTPLGPNVTGALAEGYGSACTLPGNHLLGLPTLTASSAPLIGDGSFALRVGNTTGLFGEFVLIGFSAGAAPQGLPSILPAWSGVGCHEAIDITQLVATWIVPAQLWTTTIPLPLSGLGPAVTGAELHAQTLVIDLLPYSYPPYQGLSNALRLVIGQ
ncbi:MAG: lamin tail domain-containing protein [Planctomycetota bacterium]